jgi:hypothetical protein
MSAMSNIKLPEAKGAEPPPLKESDKKNDEK